jgi:hypothetical protein
MIPALGRPKQEDLYKIKANLGYRKENMSQKKKKKISLVVSYCGRVVVYL